MSLWAIFITGLTIGGLSCVAVQGGLLASVIAARNEDDLEKDTTTKHSIWPIVAFIGSKLIAYIILGFFLGLFGSILQITDTIRIIMQIVAATYMFAVALHLMDVHPLFRYVIIQPPRFLTKRIRNQAKSKELFAPALLGLMTIFIPCGTTLAVEVLAISSGNPLQGAATMGVFVLGTLPLFFGIGYLTTKLGDSLRRYFFQFAALILVYLSITTFDSALVLAGSPFALSSLPNPFSAIMNTSPQIAISATTVPTTNGIQTVNIEARSNGYFPGIVQVKQGVPVRMNLTTLNNYSCSSMIIIPKLGIRKELPPTGTETIEFTPTEKGQLVWTCSMGMYRGIMEVV
ncbi:MAG: sulfite exporter TauE/SafE family protein [bacterium]|nr:sulfite exporter TauE/SafE family protein [bacterium]